MADERYQWLDQEAAERLLRGEPVDALDEPARSEARRLAEALGSARDAVRPPALADARAELPGEAAALAAFREATAARAAAAGPAAGAPAAPVAAPAEISPVVRLAAPVAAPVRRWGRSVRFGLAAAVAAVTVGGVAVAAGTGVLPLIGPEPAASVTAVETPEPVVSTSRGLRENPGTPSPVPDGTGHAHGSSPPPATAGTGSTPSDGPPSDGSPGGSTSGGSSSGGSSATAPPRTRTTPGPGATATGAKDPKEAKDAGERALQACRDYLAGRLDESGRRELTDLLRADETLSRFCEAAVSGAGGGASPAPSLTPTPASPEKDKDGGDHRDDDGPRRDGKNGGAEADSLAVAPRDAGSDSGSKGGSDDGSDSGGAVGDGARGGAQKKDKARR
ncbi:hypothetical protein AB0G79_32190 [Streptomyces sp. NPDC020807]|uniref:hypothetical protein n=1 Tax=Streptomyces sp. NPDC020807 TaxID=3155119 RepID=UPI0033C611AD